MQQPVNRNHSPYPGSMYAILVMILLPLFINAQDATPVTPSAYPSGKPVNFVRTWDVLAPQTDPDLVITMPFGSVRQTTQYVDGLGRPLQTVIKQGSMVSGGTAKDMVSPVVYDEFGREARKYLPFAATDNAGGFKLDPFQQQQTFYQNQLSGQNETFYYGKTEFEASPLNRPLRTYAPGNNWVHQGKGVTMNYWANTATDAVRIWQVTDQAGALGTYSTAAIYDAGQLYKNVTEDEHGKQVIEFKDKEGQVILKKVRLTAAKDEGTGQGHSGWLCTYYVYDDWNQLRAVIQPEGVKLLEANSWNINALSGNILNEQCFRYAYDHRNRMIRKKVPGAGEVYLVYDVRDRLVFTQDANLREQGKWMATLYDALNRPVITALMAYSGSFSDLQTAVTTQTTTPSGGSSGLQTDLVLTGTNSGTKQALRTITMEEGFETAASPEFTAEIVSGTGGADGETSVIEGTIINKNPIPAGATLDVLTNTFYDDYQWRSHYSNPLSGTMSTAHDNYLLAPSTSFPYTEAAVQSNLLKGMVTGTRTRVLGSSDYLYTVNFYDQKGRLIQVQSTNITGGTDILTTQYSFSSQPLLTVKQQQKQGSNAQTTVVITKTTYDELWRVAKTEKKVSTSLVENGELPDEWATIAGNSYDALGQLKTKKVGRKKAGNGSYTTDPIETLVYDYNIRGWLLGANRNYIKNNTTDHFGFELAYDKRTSRIDDNVANTYNKAQYNGNIAGMIWRSVGDGEKRKYDFEYDAVNRLLKADFTQHTGDWNTTAGVDFSMKMGDGEDPLLAYDANGNIKRMQQWGLKLTGSSQIDDMVYSYYDQSNKLKAVTEQGSGASNHQLGDFTDKNTAGNDYGYDKNGNMVTDKNKRLNGGVTLDMVSGGAITYNHLNLPQQIAVKDDNGNPKGTITYVYDAAGNKLRKITVDNSVAGKTITTTTSYMGGLVYESKTTVPADVNVPDYTDQLQFIGQEEGRIRFTAAAGATPAKLDYDYFLKDHLGNVRMVLTDEVTPAAIYQAGMEPEVRNFEVALFGDKVNSTAENKPGGFDTDNSNEKVSKVNGTTAEGRVGPGVILKVMAGDKIKAQTYAWYQPTGMDNTKDPLLPGIVANLLGQLVPAVNGKGQLQQNLTNSIVQPGMENFLAGQPATTTTPKAYLNWVLLDEEQFKLVSGSSGAVAVPSITGTQSKQLLQAGGGSEIEMKKNGYLYVYVSNESKGNVYFDQIRVEHIKGSLIEETHYYPFGLTMTGISSSILNIGKENKKKYNGNELQNKEFSDGSGLEVYDFNARTFDAQTGRFLQIDPLSEEGEQDGWGPYHYSYNNPVTFSDPDGELPIIPVIVVLVGLLLSSEPANPPSSLRNPTNADVQRWNQAKNEQTMDIVTAVAPIKGAPRATSIVKQVVKQEIKKEAKEQVEKVVNKTKKSQGSGTGRGKNDRKPDPEATGDHTVSNDKGSTTYERNDRNPSGFDEVKRVDTKGRSHNGVPTPHVHEKGTKKVRPARQDEIPKTNLDKNKKSS